jgi:hypothetical protein
LPAFLVASGWRLFELLPEGGAARLADVLEVSEALVAF